MARLDSIKPSKPQYLVPKELRTLIFRSLYWKKECTGQKIEILLEKTKHLDHIGGLCGGEPTPFLCLLLKMLMSTPEKKIVVDMIKNPTDRYGRVLGAFYVRLVGEGANVYMWLERLYSDCRYIRLKEEGNFRWTYVDVFIEELLTNDISCSVPLPQIKKRWIYEAVGVLKPRTRYLQNEFEEIEEIPEDSGGSDYESYRARALSESQTDSLAIGIKTKEGVIMVAEKMEHIASPLTEPWYVAKIMLIDENAGCAISGSSRAGRTFVHCARSLTQYMRYFCGEPAPIECIIDGFSELTLGLKTRKLESGVLDVSILIGGYDEEGPTLYYTNWSMTYQTFVVKKCTIKAIGSGSVFAERYLQEQFKEDLTLKEAETMAVLTMMQIRKEKVTPNNVAIAKISPAYHLYTTSEVQAVLSCLE